eukprot:RCo045980
MSRLLRPWRRIMTLGCAFAAASAVYKLKSDPLVLFASGGSGKELCQLAQRSFSELQKFFDKGEKKPDPNAAHPYGWTALMVAAVRGDVEMVKLLIHHGAHVDTPDNYDSGNYYAQAARAVDFPSVLDPSSRTMGFTALFYAVLSGNTEVVRILLDAGADPDTQDTKGRRAVNMVQYLPPHTQKPMLQVFEDELPKIAERRRQREKQLRREFPLEKRLRERLVGQQAPINAVASAIRRKENGWHDSDHPLVFLFLGSSGIGKTELAKQVAEYLHGKNQDAFIRIDMSEYQNQHEVAKFIGAPPGYVGHDEGGQLTKKLVQHPDAVVLLDEVEKAHPDCLTIMLQVFDEGRLTDGKGKTVECKNAIFVMTSNIAQTEIADEAIRMRGAGKGDEAFSDQFRLDVVQPLLKRAFRRDEFIGRINEILYFLPFSESELRELTTRELTKWARRAIERHEMELSWAPEVVDLVTRAYNVRYGARSIQHEVDRKVISKIAASHEFDHIQKGSKVHLFLDPNGEVQLNVDNSQVGKKAVKASDDPGILRKALGKIW